jgi:hypothetical protein
MMNMTKVRHIKRIAGMAAIAAAVLALPAASAMAQPAPGGTPAPVATAKPEMPAGAPATIIDNMMGVPSMDPIPLRILNSAPGRERFIDRRSYLARYAALRSVPQFIASHRLPGSQLGEWVSAVRLAAGAPASDVSANPSYTESMRALAVDRVNSGEYAMKLSGDGVLEREKLINDVVYLMQLRDYYELLERTALTLSVQTTMLSEEALLPSTAAGVKQ